MMEASSSRPVLMQEGERLQSTNTYATFSIKEAGKVWPGAASIQHSDHFDPAHVVSASASANSAPLAICPPQQ